MAKPAFYLLAERSLCLRNVQAVLTSVRSFETFSGLPSDVVGLAIGFHACWECGFDGWNWSVFLQTHDTGMVRVRLWFFICCNHYSFFFNRIVIGTEVLIRQHL